MCLQNTNADRVTVNNENLIAPVLKSEKIRSKGAGTNDSCYTMRTRPLSLALRAGADSSYC